MKLFLTISTFSFLMLTSVFCSAQVTLDANGPGNTYAEITQVLAPGHNPIEVPDCGHSSFGEHIDEVFDSTLNKYVFRFIMHVTPDNDRCQTFDRQRNEIKSYSQSPDNLLAVEGEQVVYRWKFKLDSAFQPSGSFTHLHQLKAVGGSEASMPQITFTARKASPDRLELRYAKTTSQTTLLQVPIAPMLGIWVQAEQIVVFGENGKYEMRLTNAETGEELMAYKNEDIRMWKTNADFIRPKWGIYRSLNDQTNLRDEEVLFADFSIEETVSASIASENVRGISVYPNPGPGVIQLAYQDVITDMQVTVYDLEGREVHSVRGNSLTEINLKDLPAGSYFMRIEEEGILIFSQKIIIQ